jgi:hypothetical protein
MLSLRNLLLTGMHIQHGHYLSMLSANASCFANFKHYTISTLNMYAFNKMHVKYHNLIYGQELN